MINNIKIWLMMKREDVLDLLHKLDREEKIHLAIALVLAATVIILEVIVVVSYINLRPL